ncbi:MAG TPA: serine hydrolase domain-containing protein [Steroidobacteraceae bacterium]|nr:serine hydrolase domain-containing protein [Steroidobacteraceae bacterium]
MSANPASAAAPRLLRAPRAINVLLILSSALLGPALSWAVDDFGGLGSFAADKCDERLAQEVSVQGLDPAFESLRPLSRATIPAFGFATEDMSSAIDATVGNYMNEWGLPGGAVAITHTDCDSSGNCASHLIFAKAYGYMDLDDWGFAEPDTRFRLASVSKPMAAMAIFKMIHDGMLKIDDKPFPLPDLAVLIGGTPPDLYAPAVFNLQLSAITVDEMLHHAGGWDRDAGPDLTGYSVLSGLESYLSVITGMPQGAPSCTELMSYVESQPLQFTPGTQTQYSNVGFCAIGEVVSETSGMSYFDFLTANVLSPFGMIDTGMGYTPQDERQDREATYYDTTDAPAQSLFPPYAVVSAPYSAIGALESQEAAAAVLSTAIDVSRFAAQVAGGQPANLPGAPAYPGWPQKFYELSTKLPSYELPATGNTQYGAGWDQASCPAFLPPGASPDPLHAYDNCNFSKSGGSQGTVSSLAVTADGYGFAAIFNGGDNTAPDPEYEIFWPGCNTQSTMLSDGTVVPPAASGSGNCALQAAYNHTAVQAWNIDFMAQYAQPYSDWMDVASFLVQLNSEAGAGRYPSRLEGKEVDRDNPGAHTKRKEIRYRARFGVNTGPAEPTYLYGKSCRQMLNAIEAAPASTPLVSLQRFRIGERGRHYRYQAVWSPPIPQLP